MASSYKIGATHESLTSLSSLEEAVPEPKSNYKPHSRYLDLGDGTVRGAGWAEAEWRWSVLPTRAQRDQLKAYCSGASAEVYIQTRTNDGEDAFDEFTAIMIWPEDEDKVYSTRRDFVIRFRKLEEYEE
jgi:hypothetical protein